MEGLGAGKNKVIDKVIPYIPIHIFSVFTSI